MNVANNLWSLALDRNQIDPTELASAIETQAVSGDLDFRTRLLIRDGMNALARHWGNSYLMEWLSKSAQRAEIHEVWEADLGAPGFPSLDHRIMETTKPQQVRQFLRELGLALKDETRIDVGGSIALILDGKSRAEQKTSTWSMKCRPRSACNTICCLARRPIPSPHRSFPVAFPPGGLEGTSLFHGRLWTACRIPRRSLRYLCRQTFQLQSEGPR